MIKFALSVSLAEMFRAFGHKNYRLFFFGQSVSLFGTWTQQVALSWLVYRLTGSTLLLGTVAFCTQIPIFLLGPIAGVVTDRHSRKRLMLWTQCLSLVQALVLACLALTGTVQIWHIIALSLFLGAINAFDMPARQSLVIEMVQNREHLGNAIALNTAMINVSSIIGPSVAGMLISTVGEGVCFLLNAISYMAVLASLLAIKLENGKPRRQTGPLLSEFRETIDYVLNFKPIMAILALLSVFYIAGAPYLMLMPAYAKEILHGNAHTFGFLMSSPGIGAFCATLYLACHKNAPGLIKIIPAAAGACGLSIAAFAFSSNFVLSVFILFWAGFAMMAQITSSNALIQTVVDEDKRGRVMSLYAMFSWGVMPFGSILAGSMAARVGVQNTLLLGAVCCISGALIFAPKLPLFVRRLEVK